MRSAAMCAAVLAARSLVAAHDQSQSTSNDARPAFEVASIKRSQPDRRGGLWGPEPGGRWQMVNVPIAVLLRAAYGRQTTELIGAPGWLESEPYDVNAKADGDPTPDQMTLMLQTLLAERCKLTLHSELRERPVFALLIARNDGRLGPAIVPSKVDCDAANAARREGRTYEGPAPGNGAPPCGWSSNGATIRVGGLPFSRIAEAFGRVDGRVIVDKTGLSGTYEFTLEYAQQPNGTDAPSLFTALQEQLGLKLVSDRASIQVLVVDHIERPTEN
jgi:uncharacterized protein (TIGR03435 family)